MTVDLRQRGSVSLRDLQEAARGGAAKVVVTPEQRRHVFGLLQAAPRYDGPVADLAPVDLTVEGI